MTKLRNGEVVYGPNFENQKKRKRNSSRSAARKRHGSVDDSSGTESDTPLAAGGKDNSQCNSSATSPPLSEAEIDAELSKVKTQRKDLSNPKKAVTKSISEVMKTLAVLRANLKNCESDIKSVCIKARNEYCRNALKNDFAMGIKE